MSIHKIRIQERSNTRRFIRDLDSQAWLSRKMLILGVSVRIFIPKRGISGQAKSFSGDLFLQAPHLSTY